MIIRKARMDEAEMIADLSRKTFFDTFAPSNKMEDMELFLSEQFTRPALEKEVLDEKGIFYILEKEGTVLGYARVGRGAGSDNQSDSVEIARFYMVKEAIGTGAARQLMLFCLQNARETGYKKAFLSVWKENHRAIAFYRKFGFEVIGETEFLLGRDLQFDHIMECNL